ncbi:MAG: cob(I)yrinic acid a,c-diamide adenosyltransferase [Bacteroidales bacterium]|nr:cob(I)yrinic acid a,c-diamide adenosyltransferase [Bacteroidales bacterium]
MNEEKGYLQVYTGNGKGKTTAALGLTLRAVGAGKKVFIAQFAKGQIYSEIKAIEGYLPGVTVRQYGLKCFIHGKPKQADIDLARQGLREAAEAIASHQYDVIILDEANIAVFYNLFTAQELLEAIALRQPSAEVVVTGRYASDEIIAAADLVTEMREIKHYYQQGVMARIGIEY